MFWMKPKSSVMWFDDPKVTCEKVNKQYYDRCIINHFLLSFRDNGYQVCVILHCPKGIQTCLSSHFLQNGRFRSTSAIFLTVTQQREIRLRLRALRTIKGWTWLWSAGSGWLSQPRFWQGNCWQKCAVISHSLYSDWNLPLTRIIWS